VAFQLLCLAGLAGAAWPLRNRAGWRAALVSPLRAPAVGAAVVVAVLLGARLTIGFRHALPLLPSLV